MRWVAWESKDIKTGDFEKVTFVPLDKISEVTFSNTTAYLELVDGESFRYKFKTNASENCRKAFRDFLTSTIKDGEETIFELGEYLAYPQK